MDAAQDLDRFRRAQENTYAGALAEIRAGRKRSHWIWYVFPQLRGLGRSETAWYYGLRDLREAEAYLHDPVLGVRLAEISAALLAQPSRDARAVLGDIDAVKVRSCMTLFACVEGHPAVFDEVLTQFYGGVRDPETLRRLGRS